MISRLTQTMQFLYKNDDVIFFYLTWQLTVMSLLPKASSMFEKLYQKYFWHGSNSDRHKSSLKVHRSKNQILKVSSKFERLKKNVDNFSNVPSIQPILIFNIMNRQLLAYYEPFAAITQIFFLILIKYSRCRRRFCNVCSKSPTQHTKNMFWWEFNIN